VWRSADPEMLYCFNAFADAIGRMRSRYPLKTNTELAARLDTIRRDLTVPTILGLADGIRAAYGESGRNGKTAVDIKSMLEADF
jgi:hypothetical protein